MIKRIAGMLLMVILSTHVVSAQGSEPKKAYDFAFQQIAGGELPLKQFEGKVLMVVNTASFCGFTPQYDGLQALYDQYREQGLVVLGVPSNDFGQQEPGSAQEIKEFCEVNFNITFPIAGKEVVSGDLAHPFYQWARSELGFISAPRWNFHKYLVGKDGKLRDWFSSTTEPTSEKVKQAVEAAIKQER